MEYKCFTVRSQWPNMEQILFSFNEKYLWNTSNRQLYHVILIHLHLVETKKRICCISPLSRVWSSAWTDLFNNHEIWYRSLWLQKLFVIISRTDCLLAVWSKISRFQLHRIMRKMGWDLLSKNQLLNWLSNWIIVIISIIASIKLNTHINRQVQGCCISADLCMCEILSKVKHF